MDSRRRHQIVDGGVASRRVQSPPGGLFVMPRDLMAVEVSRDRGAVDAEVGSELVDRGAGFIGRDLFVDVSGERRRRAGFESRP